MNIDQKARLEIMQALEKEFPDRLLEDLIEVARWVEGNGTPATTRARESRKAGMSSPRKWTNLDAIPSSVKRIRDRDGDRAEPRTLKGKRVWFFADAPFDGVEVSPDDGPFTNGPFTEVLDHE